jgi:hypothetical protein
MWHLVAACVLLVLQAMQPNADLAGDMQQAEAQFLAIQPQGAALQKWQADYWASIGFT